MCKAAVNRGGYVAYVDAEHAIAAAPGPAHVAHQGVDAGVVEAQAVDDGLVLRQPEHARLLVARLRPRGDGAHFDEAEAQAEQGVDVFAVLVQPGGEAHRVGEGQSEDPGREGARAPAEQALQAGAVQRLERRQSQAVRALGVEGEQEGPRQPVHGAVLRGRT